MNLVEFCISIGATVVGAKANELWPHERALFGALGMVICGVALLLASLLFWGCVAHCEGPLQVQLARHPAGKPKPAALVMARCDGDRYEWLCDAVTASDVGVWCDGVEKARRVP